MRSKYVKKQRKNGRNHFRENRYDNAKLIDTMLIHDYVDNIGLSISRMTAFAQKQNRDMYFAESVQAKKELASIKESEFPLVENIL